jgi:hypothetical protein
MKSNVKNMLRVLSGLMVVLVMTAGAVIAQQPTPTPTPKKSDTKKVEPKAEITSAQTGEDVGGYIITSSAEFGYRGSRIDGDSNKYKSDLNYKAGPVLFDSSFLMRSKDGKSGPFETLLVTSTGWGGDPYGSMRVLMEKPKWYRFEGSYRKFKYFRYLNDIANPNWIFSPTTFNVPPNPVTGLHGFNTRTQMGDFDLTLLPKNRTIRFNVGYSPERYSGPAYTDYHIGGNEFNFLSQLKSSANDFRLGADGTVGPIDFSFQQGFRRFLDESFILQNNITGINRNPAVAFLNSESRTEPTRTSVNYTTFSVHSLVAKKLDLTARVVHSSSTSNFTFLETMTGTNFATRIGSGATAQLAPPNILNLGQYNIPGTAQKPNTLFDFGATFLATDKLRISNTFRVETFEINGADVFNDIFTVSRGALVDSRSFSNLPVNKSTKYRKYQDIVEGDYQFNPNYSIHFGYRYGNRRIEQLLSGFALNSNAPTALVPEDEIETNHTNAFFAGFKARPVKNWTIYFDAEHGTADNVFTRIGNYNYTNIRAKSRWAPNRKINFNAALITKDNANPSEIAGVALTDFGVDVKSRTFTSSAVWTPTAKLSFSTGYNYNWVNSDSVIQYYYQTGTPLVSVYHPFGHSQYFMRNNFFYIDAIAQLFPRVSLYVSYRLNQDAGQGSRVSTPTAGTTIAGGVIPPGATTPFNPSVDGGILINSIPMSYQSPEGRLAIKINRYVDWNLGYQYYNYHESLVVGPRAQNYHAHLPYTSLRIYFGRKE